MPPTPSLPHVDPTIQINSAAAVEYDDESSPDTDTTSTRYIESITGQDFSINIQIGEGTHFLSDQLAFIISVDGQQVDHTTTWKCGEPHVGSEVSCEGRYVEGGKVRPFRFREIEKSGVLGPSSEEEGNKLENVGTIRIEAHHMQSVLSSTYGVDLAREDSALGGFSEKALMKNSLSHAIEFGEETDAPCTWENACFVDPEMKPAAVYIFHYRSQESLKALLIIPSTPTTTPEPEETPEPRLSPEEVTALQLQVAEMQRRIAKATEASIEIKREPIDGARTGRKRKRPTERLTICLEDDGEIESETVEPINLSQLADVADLTEEPE